MVGRTGSGKSATGNTIMAKASHFESKISGESITRECKRGECKHAGRKIVVVDTPGLFDTQVSYAEISKEIIRCVSMSTPGPHVFLLVIQIGRFTDEEIETLNRLFELFGEEMGNFAIITFTRLDDLEREKTTIKDYLKTAPRKLRHFLQLCNDRYITFDNKASEVEKKRMVNDLIQFVDFIVKKNGGNHYTNTMYKEAEAGLQRKIKEVEEEKELQKRQEIEQIQSSFVQQIHTVQQENKELAERVSNFEANQKEVHSDKEKAHQEINRLKEEMKNIDKKHNEEIYRKKCHEKEKKEQQAILLEEKEKQMIKVLKAMHQQQTETNLRSQEMERQRQLQLSTAKDGHNKRMEAEIQRLIDGSDQRYNEIMKILESKDKASEKLQEQNAAMYKNIREKEKEFIRQQEESKKQIEMEKNQANAAFQKQLDEHKKKMDTSTEATLQEQRKRDKKQMEEIQKANYKLQEQIAQQKTSMQQLMCESHQKISKQQEEHRIQLKEETERNEVTLKKQQNEQEKLCEAISQRERYWEHNRKTQIQINNCLQEQMLKQKQLKERSERAQEQFQRKLEKTKKDVQDLTTLIKSEQKHREDIKKETNSAKKIIEDQRVKQKMSDEAITKLENKRIADDKKHKEDVKDLTNKLDNEKQQREDIKKETDSAKKIIEDQRVKQKMSNDEITRLKNERINDEKRHAIEVKDLSKKYENLKAMVENNKCTLS